MSSFKIPAENGTHKVPSSTLYERLHDIAFDFTTVTAGTITIRARKQGASYFEAIPNGVIDISAPSSILIEGTIKEYEFTIAGLVGTGYIEITDTDTATGGL